MPDLYDSYQRPLYVFIKAGVIVEMKHCVDGNAASLHAIDTESVALIAVGRQPTDAYEQHLVVLDDDFTEEDMKNILDNGGVDVRSEKVKSNDEEA